MLGQAGFTRTDAVVGVGGGAVTDLAGFVAATWLRGVRVVQVPTTLLAMVDAAVGGKTGINTAEGKNLVGAFHPPAGVLCDLADARDAAAATTSSPASPRWSSAASSPTRRSSTSSRPTRQPPRTAGTPGAARARRARRPGQGRRRRRATCASRALREILNYGHTLGHAIEQAERYQWRHGAAVSVGMVFAAELGRLAGRLARAASSTGIRAVLTSLGLPPPTGSDRWPQLLEAMRRDKKTRGDLLRFVVLDDLARPARLEGPDPSLLVAAYTELAPGSRDAPRTGVRGCPATGVSRRGQLDPVDPLDPPVARAGRARRAAGKPCRRASGDPADAGGEQQVVDVRRPGTATQYPVTERTSRLRAPPRDRISSRPTGTPSQSCIRVPAGRAVEDARRRRPAARRARPGPARTGRPRRRPAVARCARRRRARRPAARSSRARGLAVW